ncbi:hypothetical protein [Agrobacterium pusense]|uniref:hypothetical protein n=1 Tax=Agrobacterium pusense TaxID=648995 RepID=UPI00142F05B3|nr:hypothetical protein [Agrobacterium pusense]
MAPKTTPNAPKPKKLTQAALGRHLDLSERSVRELFGKGVFPTAVNSKALTDADLDVCRVAYIQHLRDQAAGRSKETEEVPESDDPDIQLARLRKEQIELARIKRRKVLGELVERIDLRLAVSSAFARVKTVLLKVPKKHAGQLSAMEDEIAIREYLDVIIHEALDELASTPVESIGKEIDPNDIEIEDDVEE